MAFKLTSSESLEVLADELSNNLYEGVESVLTMPKVVIQSKGMEKWLSLRIADNLGITAGVEFLFLNGFFEDVILDPYAKENKTELAMLTPGHIKWLVFSLLNNVQDNPEFNVITNYIQGDQLKQLQIAEKLADIYDRYSLYRSDWLCAWEEIGAGSYEGDERWLAELWKLVKQATELSSVAELSAQCVKWLVSAYSFQSNPVHLFGVSSMPPLYLQILAEAAKHMDVYFYYLEVSHEYWGLVRSEKDLLRTAGSNYEVGNTLLATFGTRNRDFLNLLITFTADNGIEESERLVRGSIADVTDPAMSLLKRLQAGIRFMELPANKSRVAVDDRSVEFHSCYGQMRQVQALYNSLLECFEDEPSLRPKDILVLTPAIKDYVPYIKAVFGSVERESGRYIPYTISDRAVIDDNAVCRGVLAVIKLFSGRFKVSEVWGVFNDPGLQQSKGITPEDNDDVLRWINDLQVHWGIDSAQRETISGIKYAECSWQEAEERLLLGYAMGASDDGLFALRDGRLVTGVDVSTNVSSLQGWLEFLSTLFVLNRKFTRVATAGGWIEFTKNIIENLYSNLDTEAQEVILALGEIEETFNDVGILGNKMVFDVFVEELKSVLENTSSSSGFIMGGVTFCQFQPMRNIPSRVICMLGMDDGAFPRILRPKSFDIATRQRRLCDPSLKLDDQGVFLETILSVADRLLVFYSGHAMKRGEKLVSASPVEILRDYIDRYYLAGDSQIGILEQVTMSHPLQSFSKKYFTVCSGSENITLKNYSHNDLKVCSELLNSTVKAATYTTITESDIYQIIATGNELLLTDLIAFYKNPAKWYLQKRCNVYYDSIEDDLPTDVDRLELDGGYHLGKIKKSIIDDRIAGVAKLDTMNKIVAQRILPLGKFAEAEFEDLYSGVDKAVEIMASVTTIAGRDYTGVCKLDVVSETGVHFGECKIGYTLQPLDIMDTVNVNIKFGFNKSISWGYLIEFWLEHLLYSFILDENTAFESRYYGVSGKLEYKYPRIGREQAGGLLSLYLYGFYRGQVAPMPIFKYASSDYISKLLSPRSPKSPEEALFAARSKYIAPKSTAFVSYVDTDDQYVLNCFGQDFTTLKENCEEFMYCADNFVMPVYADNKAHDKGKA